MRAVEMTATGDPEVLRLNEAAAEPALTSPTQIKVRLHAAGVNPIDTKIRARGLFYGAEPPAILGCDGAGEVVAVGAQVTRFGVGDAVWFCHGGLGREPGNYAEYTVLEQAEAERKPDTLDFSGAGAAPLVLITAWEALFDQGDLAAGETVLIHAGAGGVGHVAIQLAKAHGARVITTVGSAENAAFVRALGADEVIDYHAQDLAGNVLQLTGGKGVEVCLDTVGPDVFRNSIQAMAPYGRLVTLLDPGSDLDLSQARSKNLKIAFTLMLTPMLADLATARAHHGEILEECARLVDSGQLQIHVSGEFLLEDAADAHRAIATGHTRGKLVLLPQV
jgi:NADPH2:quinone reductase